MSGDTIIMPDSSGFVANRTTLFSHEELARLLDPRSIAVVGASETPGSFGGRTITNILARFGGTVYPVNPRSGEVFGRRCYASLGDLPEVPDCVVLAVGRELVLPLVESCAEMGVGGVIVFAS